MLPKSQVDKSSLQLRAFISLHKDAVKKKKMQILEYAIGSFLHGDYNLKLPNKDDNLDTFPLPNMGPAQVFLNSLRAQCGQDLPSRTHGAALFMCCCLPLQTQPKELFLESNQTRE